MIDFNKAFRERKALLLGKETMNALKKVAISNKHRNISLSDTTRVFQDNIGRRLSQVKDTRQAIRRCISLDVLRMSNYGT